LSELNGCIDIDFTLTPFTNTLPIRRLNWQAGVSQGIQVVYIVYPARQTYTCLSDTRYHFRMDDFEREIQVNAEGLVIDYPDLFERVG
jgi:uncharacterized protein